MKIFASDIDVHGDYHQQGNGHDPEEDPPEAGAQEGGLRSCS